MPRKTKDAPGRVTPKGGAAKRPASTGAASSRSSSATSGRYTPPIPREQRSSPAWFPYMIVGFFAAGVLIILLNYLSVLGGHASNVYLFVGLGLIVAGFIAATRWH
jgi:hypothetical protein